MAESFLIDFSRQLRPTDVLRDFRDTCPSASGGKAAELNDIIENQRDFTITQWTVGNARVTVAFGGQCTLFSNRFRPGDGLRHRADRMVFDAEARHRRWQDGRQVSYHRARSGVRGVRGRPLVALRKRLPGYGQHHNDRREGAEQRLHQIIDFCGRFW